MHVEGLEIVGRDLFMIRPPRSRFAFTHIHGITWAHVRAEPSFAEHWPGIAAKLTRASFLAAHNASFDRGVLAACCAAAGVPLPELVFAARCSSPGESGGPGDSNAPTGHSLRFPGDFMNHHDPASDAEACARIVIAARREGIALGQPLKQPKIKITQVRAGRQPSEAGAMSTTRLRLVLRLS